MLAETTHFQRRDVRLEHQLGDVRGGRGALLQLLPDVFQFGSAPVVLEDIKTPLRDGDKERKGDESYKDS